jgi:hypothetical protein
MRCTRQSLVRGSRCTRKCFFYFSYAYVWFPMAEIKSQRQQACWSVNSSQETEIPPHTYRQGDGKDDRSPHGDVHSRWRCRTPLNFICSPNSNGRCSGSSLCVRPTHLRHELQGDDLTIHGGRVHHHPPWQGGASDRPLRITSPPWTCGDVPRHLETSISTQWCELMCSFLFVVCSHIRVILRVFLPTTASAIRCLLKQVDTVDRPGGLMHLTKIVAMDSLRRHFSQHASEAMHLRYLNHGAASQEMQDLHHKLGSVVLQQPALRITLLSYEHLTAEWPLKLGVHATESLTASTPTLL